jgi:hypothetical protein
MKDVRFLIAVLFFQIAFTSGCTKIVTYPDNPIISFKNHTTYITTDDLGNKIALVKLQIEFTDGDGDIGLKQPVIANSPDSLKYNFFLTLYDYKNGIFEKVDDLNGNQNFRIPYISREGQNKSLKGNIYIDLEYKSIIYDTIFYSFYLVDRKFHKSNVDSTDVIVLSGINLGN